MGIIFYCLSFLTAFLILLLSLLPRLNHIYLEDDFLWCLPLIDHVGKTQNFIQMLQTFQGGELSLFDGVYFWVMLHLLGTNLKMYAVVLVFVHIFNAILLFLLLFKRMRLPQKVSFYSSLIYLTFYGHFHAYIRPISASHLVVVFFILLLVNLYLKIIQQKENGQNFYGTYGVTLIVALLASFMRISIIIVPVIISVHIFFTCRERKELIKKYFFWMPILFILSGYQWILISLIGRQGGTLEGFIGTGHKFFYQNSLTSSLVIYVLFLGVLGGFLGWLSKSRVGQIWTRKIQSSVYLVIFIPHFFLLCLFQWITVLYSADTADPYTRWQMMSYPHGFILVCLFLFSIIVLYGFVRYTQTRNSDLIIFITWYLSLLPFLGLDFSTVPSRYLIYASPLFAVMLSLFIFEIFPQYWKIFRHRSFQAVFAAGIFIICLTNIFGIHNRLYRTILGDYLWSYDYVKTANVIKDYLRENKMPKLSSKTPLCVQGVEPIPFLDSWKSFLGNDFPPYLPFIFTLQSKIGRNIPIHINEECRETDLIFHVTDKTVLDKEENPIEPFYRHFQEGNLYIKSGELDKARVALRNAYDHPPFVIGLFLSNWYSSKISSPKLRQVMRLIEQSYNHLYIDDPKYLKIERMIQTEVLDYQKVVTFLNPSTDDLSSEDIFWPKIGHYQEYAFYWASGYYFAISQDGKGLDLARFKRGDYPSSYVAKTRYGLIQKIDADQRKELSGPKIFFSDLKNERVLDLLSRLSGPKEKNEKKILLKLKKYSDRNISFLGNHEYSVNLGGLFLGWVSLEIVPDKADARNLTISFTIRPWELIQRLSADRAGFRMTSTMSQDTMLPIVYEENTLNKIKKGKKGRSIIYHHDDLYMERKIYEEDIFSDTRDTISIVGWLMTRDYGKEQIIQSTMNIQRRTYIVVGKVKSPPVDTGAGRPFLLNLRVAEVDKEFRELKNWSLEIGFLRNDGWFLPIFVRGKDIPWEFNLH